MNYRRQKEIIEKRVQKWKRVAFTCVAVLLLVLCVFSAFYPAETWKYYFNYPPIDARKEGEMRMHFIDVGQGDTPLIKRHTKLGASNEKRP